MGVSGKNKQHSDLPPKLTQLKIKVNNKNNRLVQKPNARFKEQIF